MRWSDWVLSQIDRWRWGFFALLLVAYLLGFTGIWRPEPDSALYLTLGRNLALGRGYTYHGEVHHLAYPGWPWILAVLFDLFGSKAIVAAHVVMLLMGFASLALMYRLMRLHADRPFAVMMTVGLGISYTFYRYCFELRSDMPFMLGVMAVLAGWEGVIAPPRGAGTRERKRSIADFVLLLGGLILAVVTRPTMWTLLISLALAGAWTIVRGHVSKKSLLPLLIVPACAAMFILADPRRGGAGHRMGDYEDVLIEQLSWPKLQANVHELLDPMASEAMFGIDFGKAARIGPITLQAVVSVVALIAGLIAFRERALWGIWFALTVGMMLLVLARDRYFLPVLPMMIVGWWTMIHAVNRRLPRRTANGLFAFLFALGVMANCARIGQLFIEQRHPNPLTAIRDGRYESIKRVAKMIDANTPTNAWIIAPPKFGRILTFLADRNVVEAADVQGQPWPAGEWYILEPRDIETGISPTIAVTYLGDAIDHVQGPFDKQPWVLHRIAATEGGR